jgi:hypothetical protein
MTVRGSWSSFLRRKIKEPIPIHPPHTTVPPPHTCTRLDATHTQSRSRFQYPTIALRTVASESKREFVMVKDAGDVVFGKIKYGRRSGTFLEGTR